MEPIKPYNLLFFNQKHKKGNFSNTYFYYICGVWQLVDQQEIHKQCLSNDPKERIHSLGELKDKFSYLPDKKQLWNDLVRYDAAATLEYLFSQVPDKQQAWNDLYRLIKDENSDMKSSAATTLVFGNYSTKIIPNYDPNFLFSDIPDKQQAWNDLHRLTNDEEIHFL